MIWWGVAILQMLAMGLVVAALGVLALLLDLVVGHNIGDGEDETGGWE